MSITNEDNVHNNAVEIKSLSFKYKDQEETKAISNINLEIEKGQFVVIMGPSGAGKSTLANCLNGLIPHFIKGEYEGKVWIHGKNAKEESVSKMAKDIGLVFQDFEAQLFSTNTKLEIAFGPENFNVNKDEIEERIQRVLRIVDLKSFENRQPATLSGGQKQRLAVGSVLACEPNVLCMDEPTTDLDPAGKLGIFNIAKELHQNKDITLIIIEHETEEALNADRLIIMENGEIIRDGKPENILRDIETTDRIGIMSLQVPKYFSEVLKLDNDKLPLNPEQGFKSFNENSLEIADDMYNKLLKQDQERDAKYGEAVIKVKDLQHQYPNGKKALKGASLEIREGEFLAVLGHNGSGKTTMVKHFNGLLMPTDGDVVVCGKNTKESSIFEIGKEVGYVFQNPDHQIFADTVYDEVAFSPKIRGCSKEEIDIRVKEALRAVEMEGYEKEDPFTLTKGERQRIAVASILSARPKVIILDEPTTGLDYKEQRAMMELIKKLNEEGHTIIMITHTMWVVSEYAHRVAVVKDGKIEMYGKTRDVFSKEKELLDLYLKTPHIVSLSNKIGKTLLSIDEMIKCTKGGI
ncbi:ABC transporter ATP-binding protein [Abyssisolibacter fermentans]|uniref:ABC transporter ATP-binding protein n=1 Tax=Abyssisolibacter fermentans TaxID=1766203 RepID=UPI00082EFEE1|nr:energy-coupling factor transporter ATPase [Abyssisolibacter fermentans]